MRWGTGSDVSITNNKNINLSVVATGGQPHIQMEGQTHEGSELQYHKALGDPVENVTVGGIGSSTLDSATDTGEEENNFQKITNSSLVEQEELNIVNSCRKKDEGNPEYSTNADAHLSDVHKPSGSGESSLTRANVNANELISPHHTYHRAQGCDAHGDGDNFKQLDDITEKYHSQHQRSSNSTSRKDNHATLSANASTPGTNTSAISDSAPINTSIHNRSHHKSQVPTVLPLSLVSSLAHPEMDTDAESDANHGSSPPPMSVKSITDKNIFERNTTRHTANEALSSSTSLDDITVNDSALSTSRTATVASAVVTAGLDGNEEDDINDPGLDHAVPDEPTGSLGQSNPWSPQNQQSTCEFTHTITQYSSKRESGCKKAEYSSTTIDNFGNRWRLIVYVNGNGRASNHHLSLFLQVADAEELPFGWKKAVSYVLTLEHPSGPTLGYAKRNPDKTFKLCPKAIDWGWSQFITSDRIQQEGYIADDSLVVRASVTVKSSSVSIDSEDAELYLKCAVEEGNAAAVEACLSQDANVNCQFKDDLYTPLHTACSSSSSTGSLEVLKLLLKRGADANACNKWRETPLLIAANNGHKAAVEALLENGENGADPSLCSEAGWSALTFAAHKGYDDIVSLLLAAGAPVNCRVTEDLSTPLHKACAGGKSGHLSAVKQLLVGGADVHALNKWRETPLLTAANHGQAAAVEALLDAGGDPCKCTDTGWSPLSIAAYKGHDDVVRLLLEQGAPTEEADPTLSALLQAATKGLPETVELLLRHGADHTVTTKKGDTALSILVEQNLIDAAVEMVTEYKASVPRCSRDRKKVQRARLLINLRVKQQYREGLLNESIESDGESDQDESENGLRFALHDSDENSRAATPGSLKKTRKNNRSHKNKYKSRECAEAEARAAEEALLLELEQEDAKAQKDEAAATSKRNKKKKKKERERQHKMEEEKLRREKERKETEERQRKWRIQEDKDNRERDKREKEQRQKELIQVAKREQKAAEKRREKEEREKKHKVQEKKNRQSSLHKENESTEIKTDQLNKYQNTSSANSSLKGNVSVKVKNLKKQVGTGKVEQKKDSSAGMKNAVSLKQHISSNNRAWEPPKIYNPTQQDTIHTHDSIHTVKVELQPQLAKESTETKKVGNSSVEDELANMANGVVGFLGFDSTSNNSVEKTEDTQNSKCVSSISGNSSQTRLHDNTNLIGISNPNSVSANDIHYGSVELPAVTVFRQEKIIEIFNRCTHARNVSTTNQTPMQVVSELMLRSVIYKWVVRAAHGCESFLDRIIPSWTDEEMLVEFFQRQFIYESRRSNSNNSISGLSSIELLKDAGTFVAELCSSLAKELANFKLKCEMQLPQDWSDATVHIAHERIVDHIGSSIVVINWAKTSQVYVPVATFEKLRRRYHGCPNHFLTTLFCLVKRYEAKRMIVASTRFDYRLSSTTLRSLKKELNVSVELWNNPLSSLEGSTILCGMFSDIDAAFGAFPPFAGKEGGGEVALMKQGGSAVVLPPLDSTVTSLYLNCILNMLESTEMKAVPLSFAIFLPVECFQDLHSSPKVDNLVLLDPRLDSSHAIFIQHYEVLTPGHFTFQCGDNDGHAEICKCGSIFLILQNSIGRTHFPISTIKNITNSMTANVVHSNDVGSIGSSSSVFSTLLHEGSKTPIPASPTSHHSVAGGDFPLVSDTIMSKAFGNEASSGSRRHCRLFELVDDGDDDNMDAVSGMLNSLNVSMFHNNSSHQDVDIEAISLAGLDNSNMTKRGASRQFH